MEFADIAGYLPIVILMLMSAVPAFAYGQANNYHLRLSRLDRITCDKKIGIKAHLTTNRGEEVRGATVYVEISKGGPGDTVDPRQYIDGSYTYGKTSHELRISSPQDGKFRWVELGSCDSGDPLRITTPASLISTLSST